MPPASPRPLHSQEAGFTLVELLVVIGMMMVLLAAVLPILVSTTTTGNRQSERVTALDQDRVAFDRMAAELRGANCVTVVAPQRSLTLVKSGACSGGTPTVRLDCGVASSTAGQFKCVRTVLATGATTLMIDGLTNTDPLTVATAGTGGRPSVHIKLEKAAAVAAHPVRLEGSVSLRVVGS
jgi:type II secretory pathway pseudopilin PulG